jgi:mxaL protein
VSLFSRFFHRKKPEQDLPEAAPIPEQHGKVRRFLWRCSSALTALAAPTPMARLFDRNTWGISLALILMLLAWLMPPMNLPRRTYDNIIVFDITQSMNVEDYELQGAPVSRLTYAKAAVASALQQLPCGSRVGFAAFAEYRTLLLLAPVEVCSNYSDLLASLGNIDERMSWGHASQISKGVFWALRTAKEIEIQPNVLFLSDGQEAPPLGSEEVPLFDDIKDGKIHGWIMGVGGDIPRPIPKTDSEGKPLGYWHPEDVIQLEGSQLTQGREHLSSVREPHLRALARQTSLEFARLQGFDSVTTALSDPRYGRSRSVATDMDWLPLSIALLLLVLRFRPDDMQIGWRIRGRSLIWSHSKDER